MKQAKILKIGQEKRAAKEWQKSQPGYRNHAVSSLVPRLYRLRRGPSTREVEAWERGYQSELIGVPLHGYKFMLVLGHEGGSLPHQKKPRLLMFHVSHLGENFLTTSDAPCHTPLRLMNIINGIKAGATRVHLPCEDLRGVHAESEVTSGSGQRVQCWLLPESEFRG